MRVERLELDGPMLLYPNVHDDDRGYFSETLSLRDRTCTLPRFVQENESWTRRKGTLRGLHFQRGTSAQAKLVRCLTGAVRDVIVDIRAGSPTRFRWIAVELSAHDHTMLFIPKGFAHGFLTLTDDVLFNTKPTPITIRRAKEPFDGTIRRSPSRGVSKCRFFPRRMPRPPSWRLRISAERRQGSALYGGKLRSSEPRSAGIARGRRALRPPLRVPCRRSSTRRREPLRG